VGSPFYVSRCPVKQVSIIVRRRLDGAQPMGSAEAPSPRIRSAVTPLALFLAAVVAALAVTIVETSPNAGLLACVVVAAIIVLSAVWTYMCRRRNLWEFAGAAMLGVVGAGFD